MRHRDRESIRAFRESERQLEANRQAVLAAENDKLWAPVKAKQKELRDAHRSLMELEREVLTSPNTHDPQRFIDPRVADSVMEPDEANAFMRAEGDKYKAAHPDVYMCPELFDLIANYNRKEQIQIWTCEMLERLIARFDAAGLLPQRPEQEPVAETVYAAAEPEPAKPEPLIGYDLLAGTQRPYSKYEVDRMDSETYRRVFRLYAADIKFPARAAF